MCVCVLLHVHICQCARCTGEWLCVCFCICTFVNAHAVLVSGKPVYVWSGPCARVCAYAFGGGGHVTWARGR